MILALSRERRENPLRLSPNTQRLAATPHSVSVVVDSQQRRKQFTLQLVPDLFSVPLYLLAKTRLKPLHLSKMVINPISCVGSSA